MSLSLGWEKCIRTIGGRVCISGYSGHLVPAYFPTRRWFELRQSSLMGSANRTRLGNRLLKDKHEWNAQETGEGQVAEIVDVRPKSRLLVDDAVDDAQCAIVLGAQDGTIRAAALLKQCLKSI